MPEAESGIREAFSYIQERSPLNAERWLLGLRQLIYKSHRIVFRVNRQQQRVAVLYVRHAARRTIGETVEPAE